MVSRWPLVALGNILQGRNLVPWSAPFSRFSGGIMVIAMIDCPAVFVYIKDNNCQLRWGYMCNVQEHSVFTSTLLYVIVIHHYYIFIAWMYLRDICNWFFFYYHDLGVIHHLGRVIQHCDFLSFFTCAEISI